MHHARRAAATPSNQHERPRLSPALSAQPTPYLTGFAFVQFDERSDAADAIDNMDGAELYGRVLKVNASLALGPS